MVVLWTVGLEVQFYLLYPFIAKRFIKNPYITYFGMIIIGIIITTIIRINTTSNNIDIMVNNPLTFIMVYANGMLGAFLYVKYTKNKSRNTIKDIIFTIISIICIYIYYRLCLTIKGNLQIWQIEYRFTLSIVFITFILSTILSHKYFRIIFENRIMKFIATISFNIYIYHQFIAVKLKEFRIPYWSGNLPPNFTGDAKWQWTYFIICIIVTLIVAIIMTYLIEIPINKYIRKKIK
jgi:peptidoglycan/LPS O-acetylase OafA/YrhL